MIWAAEAMNSLLLNVAGASTGNGILETHNTESGKDSTSSFSEHLQEAVAAGSKVIRPASDVHTRTAAKPTVPGASKMMASNARPRSTGPADSKGAPGSGKDGRFRKTEIASPRAPGRTADGPKTHGAKESEPEISASPSQAKAPADGQSSSPQPSTGGDGKTSSSEAAPAKPAPPPVGSVGKTASFKSAPVAGDKPSQTLLASEILAATQVSAPVSTSCDSTLAVTQPIAPAETNSAQASADAGDCPVKPGSSGETASPQTGPTDVAGSSTLAENAVAAGNDNSAVAMKTDLSNSIPDQSNSSDPAVTVEPPPVESQNPTDDEELPQNGPNPASESATTKGSTKGSTPHNSSPIASQDFHGVASPTPQGLTGSLDVVDRLAAPGNRFAEASSSKRTPDGNAQASLSSRQSGPSTATSPAASTESAPSDQASPQPVPHSAWEGVPSMSPFNAFLAAASGTATTGQSGVAASADHAVPGAPIANVASFGFHASNTAVPFQAEFEGGVTPDSPVKTPAQAEGTARPMQDGVLEAWQNVSTHMERVNGATLNSLPNGTEMRVQMHTDAFGQLEIRATLEAGKIGAAIGVENPEAHHTLLSQVSALQQSLADRHVQLDNVTVVKTSGQNSTDLGWSSNQQRDDSAQYSRLAQQSREYGLAAEPAFAPEADPGQTEIQWGRLSVRA